MYVTLDNIYEYFVLYDLTVSHITNTNMFNTFPQLIDYFPV